MLFCSHTNISKSGAMTVYVCCDGGEPADADVVINLWSSKEENARQALTASQNIKSSIITPPMLVYSVESKILMKDDRPLLGRYVYQIVHI